MVAFDGKAPPPPRCASPLLFRTQLVERLERRIDLLTVFGIRVDLLKSINATYWDPVLSPTAASEMQARLGGLLG
jgi:hypothetical protein